MGHDVLIVGGGIAGLACASLPPRGIDVAVRESVPEVQPLEVGINLLPHAVRELDALGVFENLRALALRARPSHTSRRSRSSGGITGRAAGYQWPQLSLHRAPSK